MKKIKIWIALCLSLLLFVKIAPTAEAASEIQLHTAYYGVNREDALVGKVMPQTKPEELLRQMDELMKGFPRNGKEEERS